MQQHWMRSLARTGLVLGAVATIRFGGSVHAQAPTTKLVLRTMRSSPLDLELGGDLAG